MTATSIGTTLGIRKLTVRIGAVVTGLGADLDLDAETVAAVRGARCSSPPGTRPSTPSSGSTR